MAGGEEAASPFLHVFRHLGDKEEDEQGRTAVTGGVARTAQQQLFLYWPFRVTLLPRSELVHPASHVLQLVEGRECALPQPIQLFTKDVNLVRLRPCKLKQPVQTHARSTSAELSRRGRRK